MINITTLTENTATLGCIAEWGLSLFIDVDGYKILFDTGGGLSAIYNAKVLDVDLTDIDKIVISHGHFDHTGGLLDILKLKNGRTDVLGHPDMWSKKYSCKKDLGDRFIGIQADKTQFEKAGANFKLSKEPVWLNDNIVISGEIPMITDFEEIDSNLFVKHNDELIPDPLADDQSIGIKTEKGLVIILGCSHRGMINNIMQLQKLTKEEKVFCVIGGTHLIAATDHRIAMTIKALDNINMEKLGVSHCTGFKASAELYKHFPDVFFNNNAGTRITLNA